MKKQRIIRRNILNELSKMIPSGSVNLERPVIIDQEQDKLLFMNN